MFLCVAFGLTSGPLLCGRFAACAARFAQSLVASSQLGGSGIHCSRLSRTKTATFHGCASVLGNSGPRLVLEEGLDTPKCRVHRWQNSLLQDGVAVQLTATKLRLQRTASREILHDQAMLPVKKLVSFAHWIHVVDCSSCASGQTLCLDAFGSTHRSHAVDAEDEHDETPNREVGFC